MSVFEILVQFRQAFLNGLAVTLELAGITWAVGLGLGTLSGVLGHRWPKSCGVPLSVVSFLLAGIPFLVLLYWAHFPLQVLLGVVIDPFYTAAAILSLINTVGVAAICRNALEDFPTEFVQAARVCGLSSRQTVLRIELPMILRQILPSLLNLQVSMLQMTLFASLISVEELFRAAQRIDSTIHRPVEIYTALAFFFLLICLPLNGFALWLKHRFTRRIFDH